MNSISNIRMKHSRRSQLGGTGRVFVEEVTFKLSFEECMPFRDERGITPGREKSISKGMRVIGDRNVQETRNNLA